MVSDQEKYNIGDYIFGDYDIQGVGWDTSDVILDISIEEGTTLIQLAKKDVVALAKAFSITSEELAND